MLTLIPWTSLDPSVRETIQTIGSLMQEGCSRTEIAERLGLSPAQVAARLRELELAVLEQALRMIKELRPEAQARLRELAGRRGLTAPGAGGGAT